MMFRTVGSVLMVAALFFVSACDYSIEYESYDQWSYFGSELDPAQLGEPLEVGSAEIKGTFGESHLDAYEPAEVAAWHATGFWGMPVSTVEVQAADQDGWNSMALLEIYGGLGAVDMAPGTRRTYHIDDDTTDVFIVATGCSGLDPSDWKFDEIAETIDIEVDSDVSEEGLRTVRFKANFVRDDWTSNNYAPQTSTLSGSFQIKPMAATQY